MMTISQTMRVLNCTMVLLAFSPLSFLCFSNALLAHIALLPTTLRAASSPPAASFFAASSLSVSPMSALQRRSLFPGESRASARYQGNQFTTSRWRLQLSSQAATGTTGTSSTADPAMLAAGGQVPGSSSFKKQLLDIYRTLSSNWKTSVVQFKQNPLQYLTIPLVAGLVGYVTNWIGVKMLFQPYQWRGIPILRWENQPFGLLGWQGIVPAKRVAMSSRMVDVTLSRLLKISEVFGQLDPATVTTLLFPTVNKALLWGWVPPRLSLPFIRKAVVDIIKNVESVVDIKALVVDGMTRDVRTLGSFFQQVGKNELKFLVDSGASFGFALGLLQMLQWMVYPKGWTLPACGAIVGYVTNWVALKWIFEPLTPVKIGPFILHGMFLQRQREVSADFSAYISTNILTSQNVWNSMLEGPGASEFVKILARNVPLPMAAIQSVVRELQQQVGRSLLHPLHPYTDLTLNLRDTLVRKMNLLTPAQFEQVLHPIFQEDELTLILAGGVLGAIAGGLQWWVNDYFENKKRATKTTPTQKTTDAICIVASTSQQAVPENSVASSRGTDAVDVPTTAP